ncbi:MAG: HEAT repeat domain-containing protein [Bryobacteraceae bacterium]|nr:HEAT repeat domain-containing protein [Bryobacteraceae bacterium]
MRICERLVLTIVLLWIATSVAIASGSAPVPFNILVANADAIVVAEVLRASIAPSHVSADLNVVRVLKGTMRPGALITIDTLIAARGPENLHTTGKHFGMFFLRLINGQWALVPPISGFLLEFRSTFVTLPRDVASAVTPPPGVRLSELDKVIIELTAVVQSAPIPTRTPIDLADEYRRNPSPAMRAMFTQLRGHQNTPLRVVGLRAAIGDGEDTALSDAVLEISKLSQGFSAAIVEEIQNHFTNAKPHVVSQLGQLSTTKATTRPMRLAATVALARIHTSHSLPYLARLLDDPDQGLRAVAVGGLAKFANNIAAEGHHPKAGDWKYRTEETMRNSAMDARVIRENPTLVLFWKTWWEQNRVELLHPAQP